MIGRFGFGPSSAAAISLLARSSGASVLRQPVANIFQGRFRDSRGTDADLNVRLLSVTYTRSSGARREQNQLKDRAQIRASLLRQ